MTTLTSDQYVCQMGILCPFCHSDKLLASPMECDSGVAWRQVECGACSTVWGETYGLVGYTKHQTPPAEGH